MEIATWNVNSIRTRLEIVTNWLKEDRVDVLCLQETKVVDELFPVKAIEDCGYHVYFYGQKSYNGVALLSREPLTNVRYGLGGELSAELVGDFDDQKRVISGELDGLKIVNVYVPNGNDIDSDKYIYKLQWLKLLGQYLKNILERDSQSNICICGDFNIAPEARDTYRKTTAKDIMATPQERAALQTLVLDLGFKDSFRKFTIDGGHYSWWDYRRQGFEQNRGWLIDRLYLTADLFDRATQCSIDVTPRTLPQPSDHTPVILTIS